MLTKLFLKYLHLLLKHSFLQPQELISTRPKGVSKLSVIIGTNKPFENSQPYFTRDGKHCNRIFKLYSNFVYDNKCKWIILYFKEYNVSGRFCVLFATLNTCGIAEWMFPGFWVHSVCNLKPKSVLIFPIQLMMLKSLFLKSLRKNQ